MNDGTYEFGSTENTRTADRALAYMLKIKQLEMLALREELTPKENSKGGKTNV